MSILHLVAHYSQQSVKQYDAEGRVVMEIRAPSGPHSAIRLPNGNTLMTNWLGHGQFGTGPHVIEITADKKVVWTFADHQSMKTISSIQLLDIPGDTTKGEMVH